LCLAGYLVGEGEKIPLQLQQRLAAAPNFEWSARVFHVGFERRAGSCTVEGRYKRSI
jgi:hypothetical protein